LIAERFSFVLNALIGLIVKVDLKSGESFQGVYHSDALLNHPKELKQFCLKMAKSLKPNAKHVETMTFSFADVVCIEALKVDPNFGERPTHSGKDSK
jgi:hypothetical protein